MITLLFSMSLAFAGYNYGDQVVSLSVTTQSWEMGQPWLKTSPARRVAQAVPVSEGGENYLLTTAQAIEDATLVRVKKHGEPDETLARVRYVDREANLALLSVEDKDFYSDLAFVRFSKKPIASGTVSISHWKENQLETMEGRISRAVTFDSPTGTLGFVGLRITTDLNGGQAEAVFVGPRLVGLSIGQVDSELSVMPAEFIEKWLSEVRDAGVVPQWVGDLGISAQAIRSPALADWLGVDGLNGILVLGVQQGGAACGQLKRGDVLLAIDGHPLDGAGNIHDPLYGLLSNEYLLTQYRPGMQLPVTILRDHVRQEVLLTLRSYNGASWLIPVDRTDPPPYLMAGGLVFREYDEFYSARAPELRILALDNWGSQNSDQRRIVVLAMVLPDPYNLGYHSLADLWVEQVNGQAIDGVEDVLEALKHPINGYDVVRFHPNPRIAEAVLDAATLEAATQRIAAAYGVPETYRAATPPPDIGAACE